MYKHNAAIKRWLTGGLVIAAAGFPSAALARYAPDVPGSPTGTPSCALLRDVQHLDARSCAQPHRHRHRPRQVHGHTRRVPHQHHCTPSANECNFPSYDVLAPATDRTRVATWTP